MGNTELTIFIDDDNLTQLKKIATKNGSKVETVINSILSKKFKRNDTKKSQFPTVALIKEGLNLETAGTKLPPNTSSHKNESQQFNTPMATNSMNTQAVERRKQIESEMNELSLLIQTSSGDKKNNYAMQYAQLAIELNALL